MKEETHLAYVCLILTVLRLLICGQFNLLTVRLCLDVPV